jgi:CheY-like chemotaxis protein
VDDSETSRKILSRLLKPISIVLDTANDGVEGVQKVRERLLSSEADYDVVISDSFMPNMNGPTMVAAIRELGFKGIVLGYTGTDDQEDHSKFKDAGTDAVLLKPMSADKLRNILNIPFKTPPTSPGKSPKS